MSQHVMTFNAGSSSIKFALFERDGATLAAVASGLVEMVGSDRQIEAHNSAGEKTHAASWTGQSGEAFHADGLRRILDWRRDAYPVANVTAAGHRVVHGGIKYTAPVVVTDEVLRELNALIPLAPLHEPHNIAAILAARTAWPDIPQVACFDTSFHRSHPFVNDVFALPRGYFEQGVRRYGFHGLSYEYVSQRLRQIAPQQAAGRVVVAHLGNGASMCAMRDGRSVASTMGFTALDGLPMGTRCGQLDPGVLLFLLEEKRMDAAQIADLLYHRSGLKGMSGVSHDMRELEASDRPEAKEAIEYFVARIRHELGGLAAALEGIDGIVFCGGIGEHAWRIRQSVLEGLGWMGVEIDAAANQSGAQVISSERSRVRVFVIPTNEEIMIASHTLAAAEKSGR